MERNNQFEEFLANKTDGYLMQPSNKVWNKIQQNIGNKYKPTFIAITALFALMLLLIFNKPTTINVTQSNYALLHNIYNENLDTKPINQIATIRSNEVLQSITNKKIAKIIIDKSKNENNIVAIKSNIVKSKNILTQSNTKNNIIALAISKQKVETPYTFKEDNKIIVSGNNSINNIDEKKTAIEPVVNVENESIEVVNVSNNEEVEKFVNEANEITKLIGTEKIENKQKQLPQTNSTVSQDIAKVKLKSKAQFHIATGIGYRVLYDKRNSTSTIPFAAQTNTNGNALNGTVFHKPSTSIETGVVWVKPITKNLEFKIGGQVNYNSYKIKASEGQAQLATINLTGNSNGSQLNSVSTIRNADGVFPQWIENSSLIVAMPIGLNFLTTSSNKIKFGLGTTIQPSLMVKSKMLLLSTDFRNYMDVPYLVRKFNLNTAIETFIAVSGKKLQWQFGPQLRYQLLSTYSKKYPFKENLFDYGFKIAIGKPF